MGRGTSPTRWSAWCLLSGKPGGRKYLFTPCGSDQGPVSPELTCSPSTSCSPSCWMLWALVDQSSPAQAWHPWVEAPREPSALRSLHKEVLHMPWGRGPGNTSSPLSPPGPTGPPHHTWLFSLGKGMSFSMKSYKVVEDFVFSKPSHSRVLLVPFLCLHSKTLGKSPWCTTLQVRTPQKSSGLCCGVCWHVWELAPGLYGERMQETVQPSDCRWKQGPFLIGCREAWQITKWGFMGLCALLCHFFLSSCLQMLAAGDKLASQLERQLCGYHRVVQN